MAIVARALSSAVTVTEVGVPAPFWVLIMVDFPCLYLIIN
nr:MAG TPA: hypothetical protein [Caudoviricetes sp.]